MAAARCVFRSLWTNQVLTARICTRLTAQPTSLFSSESGKILGGPRTFKGSDISLANHISSFRAPCHWSTAVHVCHQRYIARLKLKDQAV